MANPATHLLGLAVAAHGGLDRFNQCKRRISACASPSREFGPDCASYSVCELGKAAGALRAPTPRMGGKT